MDKHTIHSLVGRFRAGEVLVERFTVVRKLGSGAVGTVLLVLDEQLGNQQFAMKIPHPQLMLDRSTLQRFRNEIILHRQLAHPAIVRIFHSADLGEGLPFVTMEYVAGCSLAQLLQQYPSGRMPAADAQYVLEGILEPLAFAHGKGVVHRDIKPDNVLFSLSGSLKLSDFGLAHVLTENHDFTRTGESVGTPVYMAPEQFRGGGADERTDLYSLGILGYELLAGRPPFPGSTYFALAKSHIEEPLPDTLQSDPSVPAVLAEFIARSCTKDPGARFQSAAEACRFLKETSYSGESKVKATRLSAGELARSRIASQVRSQQRPRMGGLLQPLFFRMMLLVAFIIAYVVHIGDRNSKSNLLTKFLLFEQTTGVSLVPVQRILGLPPIRSVNAESLIQAIKSGDKVRSRALVLAGAEPCVSDSEGSTALHLAATEDTEIIQHLSRHIHFENCINWPNDRGETPLLRAVTLQRSDVVHHLLNRGAAVNSDAGHAVRLAVDSGNSRILETLLVEANFPQLHIWGKDGLPPLHAAADKIDAGAVRVLLKTGANPGGRDSHGRTVPMLLLTKPYSRPAEKVLQLVLAAGSYSRHAMDNSGKTEADYLQLADPSWRTVFERLESEKTSKAE